VFGKERGEKREKEGSGGWRGSVSNFLKCKRQTWEDRSEKDYDWGSTVGERSEKFKKMAFL
jgi:hypothetical protein